MGAPHPVQNGLAEHVGPRGLINRTEYVRVLEQALRALGYDGIAEQLERESGIQQQPPQAAAFRSAVLAGSYDAALQLLPSVAADDEVLDRARFLLLKQKYIEGIQRGERAEALQVLRLELQPLRVQQQVLHSLAALLLRSSGPAATPPAPAAAPGTPGVALAAPASTNNSGSGVSGGSVDAGVLAEGRAALLDELQESLMPQLLIPERRLEELVEQALLSQLARSQYHNTGHVQLSLFSDYQAGADQLPTEPSQVLEEHSSEVWGICFSPDGAWAASASKDGSALLWAVTPGGRFERSRRLFQQLVPCQLASFSPDSRLVLTASSDAVVRVFDVATGKQLRQYRVGEGAQQAALVAASWFPDSRHFLAASHKQLAVYDVMADGASSGSPRRLPCAHTYIYDAVVGPAGTCVISVGQDRKIAVLRLSDQRTELLTESGTITSLHLSPCGRFLTTNLSDSVVHLWKLPQELADRHPSGAAGIAAAGVGGGAAAAALGLAANSGSSGSRNGGGLLACGLDAVGLNSADGGSMAWPGLRHKSPISDPLDALPAAPLHEFRMPAGPSRYVLRSCVGGATSGFVACGSEDCRLYIWSRITGVLLASLQGHTACINAVAWNPRNPYLLATASDDGSIRTFLAPAAARGR